MAHQRVRSVRLTGNWNEAGRRGQISPPVSLNSLEGWDIHDSITTRATTTRGRLIVSSRDARGRFVAKSHDELSPAYRRRIESATAKGKSFPAARGHGTASLRMWETAGLQGQPKYDASIEVLRLRRAGLSWTKATRQAGITKDTALRYTGAAYEQDAKGRWIPKKSDRLYRSMRFHDGRGWFWVEPANSREANKLAAYQRAVKRYLETGDDRGLRKFKRMMLKTRQKTSLPFLTDLDQLDRLGEAGQLSFEDLYQH